MSYVNTPADYYTQFQPGDFLHAGGRGWKRAPWVTWGPNPYLVGAPRIALGSSPDGLGAYYANRYNQSIGATDTGARIVMGVVVIGLGVLALGTMLAAAKSIGSKPAGH